MKAVLKAMKPYLFWIITGIVLIVEIAWIATDKPMPAQIKSGNETPQSTRQKADTQIGNLRKLVGRAERTMENEGTRLTEEPIAPENQKELDALIKEYIPHNTWVQDIQSLAEDLELQAEEITSGLQGRSKFLHEPIGDDGGVWFDDYKLVSRELVRKALQEGLYGDGSIPEDIALEEDARYRSPLGLYSGQNSPPESRFARLAFEFHLARVLVDAMVSAQVELVQNPLYVNQVVVEGEDPKTFDAAEPGEQRMSVQLQSIQFEAPIANAGVELQPFKIVMRCHPGAAIAVGAALDNLHLDGGPLVVRTASHASRIEVPDRASQPLYDSRRMMVEYTTTAILIDYAVQGE